MLFQVLILVLSGSTLVLSNPVIKGTTKSKVNELPGELPNRPGVATNACQKFDELRKYIRKVTVNIKEIQESILKESDDFIILEKASILRSKYGELSSKNKALKQEIADARRHGCKKAQQLVDPELINTLNKIEAVKQEVIALLESYLMPAISDNDINNKKKRDTRVTRDSEAFKNSLKSSQKKLTDHQKSIRAKSSSKVGTLSP